MPDRSTLISRLLNNRGARESYIRSKLNVLIPSQLRGLRLKYPMTQKELAIAADMKQPRISAMERPGETQFTVETLIRLAAALKVGLVIKFVPFGEMLRWENLFSQDSFNVTQIDSDADFIEPKAAQTPEHNAITANLPQGTGNKDIAVPRVNVSYDQYGVNQRVAPRGGRPDAIVCGIAG